MSKQTLMTDREVENMLVMYRADPDASISDLVRMVEHSTIRRVEKTLTERAAWVESHHGVPRAWDAYLAANAVSDMRNRV